MIFLGIPHFESAVHTFEKPTEQARFACALDFARFAVAAVDFRAGVPYVRVDNRLVRILRLDSIGFRLIDLLVIFVGERSALVLHHVTDVDLASYDLFDRDFVPEMIAEADAFRALLLVVIISRRGDVFLVHQSCDFAVTVAFAAIAEQLANIFGGGFVDYKSMFVTFIALLAVRHIRAEIIARFGVNLLDRLDFLACFFALELVKQIFERHDIVVVVIRVNAVVQCDKPYADHREKVIRELPDLDVIPSESAQILDKNQIDLPSFASSRSC